MKEKQTEEKSENKNSNNNNKNAKWNAAIPLQAQDIHEPQIAAGWVSPLRMRYFLDWCLHYWPIWN